MTGEFTTLDDGEVGFQILPLKVDRHTDEDFFTQSESGDLAVASDGTIFIAEMGFSGSIWLIHASN